MDLDLSKAAGLTAAIFFFGVLPIGATIYSAVVGDAAHHQAIKSSRRTEMVNGRKYSVYTLKHAVLREKNTGRLGIALERGYSNEPTTVGGRVLVQPEWTRIQFFRKTDGEPVRVEWRRFSKFEIVGTASVDYLSRRTGLRTERLMRYTVDLAKLMSEKSQPRSRRRARPSS